MSEYLPSLKPVFEADGCFIYNCNSDSNLKVFPFVSFEDAIKESTGMLGNILEERVWGMYSKPDEKAKWKDEPTDDQKVHLKTLEAIKQHQVLSPDVFKVPEKKQKPPKPQIPQPIITHVSPNIPRVDGNGNPLPNIPPTPPQMPPMSLNPSIINVNLSNDVSTYQPPPTPPMPPPIPKPTFIDKPIE